MGQAWLSQDQIQPRIDQLQIIGDSCHKTTRIQKRRERLSEHDENRGNMASVPISWKKWAFGAGWYKLQHRFSYADKISMTCAVLVHIKQPIMSQKHILRNWQMEVTLASYQSSDVRYLQIISLFTVWTDLSIFVTKRWGKSLKSPHIVHIMKNRCITQS